MSSKKIVAVIVVALLVAVAVGAGAAMGGDASDKEENVPVTESFVRIGFKDNFSTEDTHRFETKFVQEDIFKIDSIYDTSPRLFRITDMDGEKANITYENLRDCAETYIAGLKLSFDESLEKGSFDDYAIRCYGSLMENGAIKSSDMISAEDVMHIEATLYLYFDVEKSENGTYLVSGKECMDAQDVIDAVNPDSNPSKYRKMGTADITTAWGRTHCDVFQSDDKYLFSSDGVILRVISWINGDRIAMDLVSSTMVETKGTYQHASHSQYSPADPVDPSEPTDPVPGHTPTLGEKNALRSAKQYLAIMPFSYNGLVKQLKFEGYTDSEATYAADNCGADWYEQAAKSAKQYMAIMPMSKTELYNQLLFEGYTSAQANYGVKAVGF